MTPLFLVCLIVTACGLIVGGALSAALDLPIVSAAILGGVASLTGALAIVAYAQTGGVREA